MYYEVGGYTGTIYHCKECGYIGAFVIEANKEMIEKIQENYKREREKETNYSDESGESKEAYNSNESDDLDETDDSNESDDSNEFVKAH